MLLKSEKVIRTIAGLGDVNISSIADKNLLQYDVGANLWKNVTPSILAGTLNHALLLNRLWSAAGHVIDASMDFAGNNAINVGALGVGIASPESIGHFEGASTVNLQKILTIRNKGSENNATAAAIFYSAAGALRAKGWVGFRRTGANGVGELIWGANYDQNNSDATIADLLMVLNASGLIITGLNLSTGRIVSVGNPVDNQDATTKIWVVSNFPTRAEWGQNGFPNKTDTTIAFDDGSRRFTVNPTGASFDYYIAGVKHTVASSDVENVNYVDIADTEGDWHFFYADSTLTAILSPTHSQISDIMRNKASVAIVFWDADNSRGQMMEERHGLQMSPPSHVLIHETIGARYDFGLALNSITVDENGSLDSHAQFGVDAGEILDEDNEIEINAVGATIGLQIWHRDASGWKFTTNSDFSMLTVGSGRLAWDDDGSLTEVPNGDFVLCHVFAASFSHNNPVAVIGQGFYTTKKLAQAGAKTEISTILSIANVSPELKPLASVIFQTKNTYSNALKAIIVPTESGDDYIDVRKDNLNPAFSTAPDPPLWEEDGPNVKLTSPKHVDFANLKAIAMVCDNGPTLPATPTKGQWFLHTPTGRDVLCQYNGSFWTCLWSLGAVTVYVDKTDGTDSQDGGFGVDSDAFATVQFAVNQVPISYSGNVIININNETYPETVTIRGKQPTGDFTLRLLGTMSVEAAKSSIDSETATTITDTGAFTSLSLDRKLVRFTKSGETTYYNIIRSHDNNTLTLAGQHRNDVDNTWDYEVLGWGTKINGGVSATNDAHMTIYTQATEIQFIDITGDGYYRGIDVEGHANVELIGCRYLGAESNDRTGVQTTSKSARVNLSGCYFYQPSTGSRFAILINSGASKVTQSWLEGVGKATSGSIGMNVISGGTVAFDRSLISGFNIGYNLSSGSVSRLNTGSTSKGYVEDCDTGISASLNGVVENGLAQNFSGNNTDTNTATGGQIN